MMERSVAVLGGDRRSVLLAKLLCDEGYEVCTWGLDALNAVPLAAAVGAQAVRATPCDPFIRLYGTEAA